MQIRTLNELFLRAVEEHDAPDAFRFKRDGSWHDVPHREAFTAVAEISAGLVEAGVRPGDRVALLCENRVEWALLDYAILGAGGVTVPIYATLPGQQVEEILADCGAGLLFVSTPAQLEKMRPSVPRLSGLRALFVIDPPADLPGDVSTLDALRGLGRGSGHGGTEAFASRARLVKEHDHASIIYTSGTTGRPKGVVLTHANIVSNVVAALQVFPIGPSDSCLSFLPLCHIFERMAGHFTMFHAGASIAYAESMGTVPENLLEVRPTIVLAVPRFFEKMHARVIDTVERSSPLRRGLFLSAMEAGRERSLRVLSGRPLPAALRFRLAIFDRLVFAKLRDRTGGRIRFMVSGGAPLGETLATFFHAAGITILEGYGLTETSPVIAVNRIDSLKPGTVGPPIPGVEVKIADDGEILVKSPGVMEGYYNLPEETARAFEGGWFHTGDIGELDSDGCLRITDRKKDLIVTAGGKKVSPQPFENRIKADPYFTEAILVGDRRPYVVALVVPDFARLREWAARKGIAGDDAALARDPRTVAFLAERVKAFNEGLASFEQVKRVGVIDRELTVEGGDLTPSLKVRRRTVLERFGDLLESLYTPGTAPPPPENPDSRSGMN